MLAGVSIERLGAGGHSPLKAHRRAWEILQGLRARRREGTGWRCFLKRHVDHS